MPSKSFFSRRSSRSSNSSQEYDYARKSSSSSTLISKPEGRELHSKNSPSDHSRKLWARKESVQSTLSREISQLNDMIEMQHQRNEQLRREVAAMHASRFRLPDITMYDGHPQNFDQFEVNLLSKIHVDGRALGRQPEWILYGYSRLEQAPAQAMNGWILERLCGRKPFDWNEFLEELEDNFKEKPDTPDFTTFI